MSTSCGTVRLIAGPAGSNGSNGNDGANGVNAYTVLSAQFTMPAELATANASVADTSWMAAGNVYFLQGAGWLEATAIVDAFTVTLKNLEDAASGAYPDNVAPGTVIAVSSQLVAAGLQGPSGSTPAGAFLVANNLSEGTPATMRSNIGVGTISTQNANAVAITGGAITGITDLAVADGGTGASTAAGARANLSAVASGLATGGDLTVSATDKVLGRFSAGAGAIEEISCTSTGRSLISLASTAAVRNYLNILSGYGILGTVTAWDLNSATTDTAITMLSSRYIIDKVRLENASLNMTTATGGLFTAAGGGGTTIAADQSLAALTATTKFLNLTLQAITGTDVFTAGTLYARCGTAQGAAATANLWILGWKLD